MLLSILRVVMAGLAGDVRGKEQPAVTSEPEKPAYLITLRPDHADYLYNVGQTAVVSVQAAKGNGGAYTGKCKYKILHEDDALVIKEGTLDLSTGAATMEMTLDHPGFVRLHVWPEDSHNAADIQTATVGFDPEKIRPTQTLPADFMDYWKGEKAALDAIPVDLHRQEIAGQNPDFLCEYVDFQNVDGKRFYIIMTQPRRGGKYGIEISIPGAGIYKHPVEIRTLKDTISITLSIHDFRIDQPMQYYTDHVIDKYSRRSSNGRIERYERWDIQDRNKYYYHSVIMGLWRTLDVALSQPNADPSRVLVTGGSQGGGLTLIMGGLDSRITCLVAYYPALCDHTAAMVTRGRQTGWPRVLEFREKSELEEAIKTTQYYDVCNFARFIKAPVFMAQGFSDKTCPPSGCYAAYSQITSPKELLVDPASGHSFTKKFEKETVLPKEAAFRKKYLGSDAKP